MISDYSKLCASEFEGENIVKCEGDEGFYLYKRIDDLRRDFKNLQEETNEVNYLQLGSTVGDTTKLNKSVEISSVREVPPQLLADIMSLEQYQQVESELEAPFLITGVIIKPLTGDSSRFYIIPENDIDGSVELKEVYGTSFTVTEAEFGTSDREKLDFCTSRISNGIPFTAKQHPCFGAFLINVEVDGSDEIISVTRTLLAYKLKIQDFNAIEQMVIDNEAERISSLFNEHLYATCINNVKGNKGLKEAEQLSLRKAEIFSIKCGENLFSSKILLPSSLYQVSDDRKIQIDKDFSKKLYNQLEESAQNLANCPTGLKLIRSAYEKKYWIDFLGQNREDTNAGSSTKRIKILGTSVTVPRKDNSENVVIVRLYRCKA